MRVLPITVQLALGALAAGEMRLPDAAQSRDWDQVANLLQQGADPNTAQVDGTTALHWAAHLDHWKAAQALVKAGANAKAANRYGMTPLSLACENGSGSLVELLLAAGADANAPLPGGETPLMTAARTGRVEAVKALLKAGAAVDARESTRGQTALMWAAAADNVEVVNALIEAGANVHLRVSSGFTPFLFSVREGKIGAVRALLKAGANVNETIKPAPNFVQKPRPGPAPPRAGTSALVIAATNAHYDLATILLEAGADANANGSGYTALHAVTWVRRPGLGDNDPAPPGSGKMTSLEFIKKLKEHGADLNSRITKKINAGLTRLNTAGATAFAMAARTGDAEMMRALAALGADPLIPNADGSTPLIIAAGLGTRSPGEDAGLDAEVIEAVKAALDLGNNIDAVDDNGETAMHGAAYKNSPGAVLTLAERGADIKVWNKKNRFGWTPLDIAMGYRFGNFKPSPPTIEAFHKVMRAAGLDPVEEFKKSNPKGKTIY
jgi:ankyrin repeat protein